MTDHSEAQVGEDRGAQRLIASGTEIAGGVSASLVSAATGLILGGPEGAALGGAAGASLSIGLRWLGGELSSRLLSPREEQRLGYVYTLAAAEIAERVKKGERIRDDGFFGGSHQGRSDAEEVWESALMKSQREPEEKKLPKPESTDRSLTGRAAGLPESSAGASAFAGRCRSEEPSLSVAQRGSGALRAPARGCARRARACWREPRSRAGAVSGRQAGSGSARNRASAAAHWPAQGQRFARCRVQRRAEWVSRPARAK